MSGVTNRGNSAWIGSGEPSAGIEAGIAMVEAFYRRRGIPPMFQLTPLSDPRLDALLAARGYGIHDPTSVQVADPPGVAALTGRDGIDTCCETALGERWFEVSGRRGRFQGEAIAIYRDLLERLAGRCVLASALDSAGMVAAVGLGVLATPLAGIFSMLTLPALRGRGFGGAVLAALARFSAARGATQLYLQVERRNTPALELYARAGFRERYGYHYRRR
jgi:GNAT superfamily N-acetyltransferase